MVYFSDFHVVLTFGFAFTETLPPQMRRLIHLQTLIINDNPMLHAQLRYAVLDKSNVWLFSRYPWA